MKLYKFLLLGISTMFVVFSCQTDMEEYPVEQYTLEYVFSKSDSAGLNARFYLNSLYNNMLPNGHDRIGGDYLDAASDDAITSALSTDNSVYRLSIGRYTAGDRIGSDMGWATYYNVIRQANTFINNIDRVPLQAKFNNHAAKNIPMTRAWKAQARFLKMYAYFELVKRYGGVPIVGDDVYQLGSDMELPRNTFAECIEYIVKGLDEARDSLMNLPVPQPSSDAHMVTSEGAMALKSRVLLYAASPLFNEKPIEAGNELVGYASYDPQRWKLASDAARYFMDNFKNIKLNSNFNRVFRAYYISQGDDRNEELIFFRQGGNNRNIETSHGPVGFSGDNLANGRTSPTQNLVDAFPMKDGKAIGESEYPYSYATMYENRDPRFYNTVLYNGARWLNTDLQTYIGGVSNPNTATQKTKTSYYMRKFMGDFENSSNYTNNLHLWVIFRYAEILLNFAEAENEYSGPTSEVYQVLKDLRKRAGIEEGEDGMYGLKVGMTKEEMRKAIQLERRLELAFEEHRYWDIRRWKIAEDIYKEPLRGFQITSSAGVLSYREESLIKISFEPYRYLYPIPYSEVINNKNMDQNPKW